MKTKKIRIIKKRDLSSQKRVAEKKEDKVTDSAKQIVSNVSTWVNDLQQRKREETKKALETIFSNGPQNVES